MSTLTVYPDPGTGSTTTDGRLMSGFSVDWKTITGGRGVVTESSALANGSVLQLMCDTTLGVFAQMVRGILTFDTSALSGSTVSSASLHLYKASTVNSLGGSVVIVSSNPADPAHIATSDWSSFGSTAFATPVLISTIGSGYKEYALNASGISAINTSGITKLGTRLDYDISDSEPVGGAHSQDLYSIYMADQTGTTHDPKLVIEYTTVVDINSTPSPETMSTNDSGNVVYIDVAPAPSSEAATLTDPAPVCTATSSRSWHNPKRGFIPTLKPWR